MIVVAFLIQSAWDYMHVMSSQISNIVCSEINSDVNRVESTLKSLDLYSLGLRFPAIWNLCLLLFFHFTSIFCSA